MSAAANLRRESRHPTNRKASARIALGIDLLDLSLNGARARVSIPLPTGTLVKLGLGQGGADRHARVVWTEDGVTGFEFLAPIDAKELPGS
ncbi:PilZ domain-containing protein [Sphingomonas guangdongensis]|uniref:PilZ domain-containing protein n=1 Tax=Sphingomonas guangdongensis TaxID=1141890 RepID=A0A285QAT3_9SPHN|nr:PilZ domain-containing protein [Sphingomonas guangdongensis]SOB78594.1 PilZ domain-containing protein [Sphingomonas guangdongensis]